MQLSLVSANSVLLRLGFGWLQASYQQLPRRTWAARGPHRIWESADGWCASPCVSWCGPWQTRDTQVDSHSPPPMPHIVRLIQPSLLGASIVPRLSNSPWSQQLAFIKIPIDYQSPWWGCRKPFLWFPLSSIALLNHPLPFAPSWRLLHVPTPSNDSFVGTMVKIRNW